VDGDGKNDVAYGPFWFAGPEFSTQRRFAEGKAFPVFGYSDNFFSFVLEPTTGELRVGYMDAHAGRGTTSRARHFKIEDEVLLNSATGYR
jgi:hypothetical protein